MPARGTFRSSELFWSRTRRPAGYHLTRSTFQGRVTSRTAYISQCKIRLDMFSFLVCDHRGVDFSGEERNQGCNSHPSHSQSLTQIMKLSILSLCCAFLVGVQAWEHPQCKVTRKYFDDCFVSTVPNCYYCRYVHPLILISYVTSPHVVKHLIHFRAAVT